MTDLEPWNWSAVEALVARRCLWESDCPFQIVKDRYIDSLALVRDRCPVLSRDDRDWLLFRTALRILFKPTQ